jgi:hypothetical protein
MDANETGPPGNADGQLGELAERREGNETIRIITHAAEQVKPYSYRAEALRELAAFRPFQEWKRRRRLQIGTKP